MNNDDNGFNKAQRAYDNQLPPEDDEYEDCPECEGTGEVLLSDCCGAEIDSDIMVCTKCKEHCGCSVCDECNGTGHINLTVKKREAYEEYLEKKAEEARYEQLMEQQNDMKTGSDTDRFLDRGIEE